MTSHKLRRTLFRDTDRDPASGRFVKNEMGSAGPRTQREAGRRRAREDGRMKPLMVGLLTLTLSAASAGLTNALWQHASAATAAYWAEYVVGLDSRCTP
jgi:hypothetical protein